MKASIAKFEKANPEVVKKKIFLRGSFCNIPGKPNAQPIT